MYFSSICEDDVACVATMFFYHRRITFPILIHDEGFCSISRSNYMRLEHFLINLCRLWSLCTFCLFRRGGYNYALSHLLCVKVCRVRGMCMKIVPSSNQTKRKQWIALGECVRQSFYRHPSRHLEYLWGNSWSREGNVYENCTVVQSDLLKYLHTLSYAFISLHLLNLHYLVRLEGGVAIKISAWDFNYLKFRSKFQILVQPHNIKCICTFSLLIR